MSVIIKLITAIIKSLFKVEDIPIGTTDLPDDRDYEDTSPHLGSLPSYVNLLVKARNIVRSQTGGSLTEKTQSQNSCSSYGAGDNKRIINLTKGGEVISFLDEVQWTHQEEEEGADRASGATLQGAAKMLVKYPQGFPLKEYRRIRDGGDIDHLKKRLAMGTPIYTAIAWKKLIGEKWSSNYGKMLETGLWEYNKNTGLGGHCVNITGYDDTLQCFICWEPMRKDWGGNGAGVFFIPYDEVENTMSKYVFYDNIDETN